jgi:23S rRNA (cytosine1962-C5)-methyltransferase
MEKILLRRTSRILAGHSWIFSNELASSPKNHEPGSLVEVYDIRENFIGIGYINPNSLISIRLLTRKQEQINPDFFRKRILDAIAYRKKIGINEDAFRVIYSESDFLPGLIVDKFSECLVMQFLTFGMEKLKDIIIPLFDEIFKPAVIVLKNDSHSRVLEGLPLSKEIIKGTLDKLPVINEAGISIEVNPLSGQKTGFFLDQRENRIALKEIINGGKGLDLFCYTGAWGLQIANKGAAVTFVDESENAISQARLNAKQNNIEQNCNFIKADAFDFLRNEINANNSYDFIILDPPAFVKNRLKIKEALKGYKEINTLAMKLLKDGGILATSSCSYHISKEIFIEILRYASKDAGKQFKLLEFRSQAKDHPILLSVPETEYLKCAFLSLQN